MESDGKMLYANYDLTVRKDKQRNRFVLLGQKGKNCRQIQVAVSGSCPNLRANQLEKDFSFERNEEREWTITASKKGMLNTVYLILSTQSSCSGGRSYISQLCSMSKTRVIVRANGINELRPYAGLWETMVLKTYHGDVFRLTWGTYNCARADTLYLVWKDNVYCSDLVRFDRLGERLGEIAFPWQWQDDQLKISLRDWQVL